MMQRSAAIFEQALSDGQLQPAAWDEQRFKFISVIADAARNQGRVELVADLWTSSLVAVKVMPASWVCQNPMDFFETYSNETEVPWHDVASVHHLGVDQGLSCVCGFVGIFRRESRPVANVGDNHIADDEICFALSYCDGGDLFSYLERMSSTLKMWERENLAKPLMRSVFEAVRDVHGKGLAHGDLSLENVLLKDRGSHAICLIDFAAATGVWASGVRGKAIYQAPEMHSEHMYHAFSADAFSLGVMLLTLVSGDYPWKSTQPGECRFFEFAKQSGMFAFLVRRKITDPEGKTRALADVMSPSFSSLIAKLLDVDPKSRISVSAALEEPWLAEAITNGAMTTSELPSPYNPDGSRRAPGSALPSAPEPGRPNDLGPRRGGYQPSSRRYRATRP